MGVHVAATGAEAAEEGDLPAAGSDHAPARAGARQSGGGRPAKRRQPGVRQVSNGSLRATAKAARQARAKNVREAHPVASRAPEAQIASALAPRSDRARVVEFSQGFFE